MGHQTPKASAPAGSAPSYVAYQLIERKGEKAIWRRIGAAWQHRDGQGLRVKLDALRIDGTVELRVPLAEDAS